MSSQFGNKPQYNFAQPNPAAPPPTQWNVPSGAPGNNLSPNPQMWNAPTTQQWNHPAPQQWNNPVTTVIPQTLQSAEFHQAFLKGKPKALGITLIIVGILHIAMGIAQIFTSYYTAILSGIPFWGAIFNIITGSLAVSAVSSSYICLIKGSLGLGIVVSIFSVVGLILNIVDYFVYYYCYGSYETCKHLLIAGHVLRGFFILTYLLQFSLSVSISVFATQALNYNNATVPNQVFILQNSAEVLEQPTVSGSYPTFLSQRPSELPYVTQNGMFGGPTP
ncbi:membrane-spanning 4-domains subfamily A member 12-like [Pyxicephalus adspersus]|uniref:membrane-spanning 4-domains subfamily A member 12-like n=1 Tax=Pyxicephalus adspersus TaxID=30357 RepID=UPI003B5BCC50